ncbi:hypothetical protein Gorai_004438, partial [Gossypium raimondii]|nr:hypothetical protein [Gossypium raimondii]
MFYSQASLFAPHYAPPQHLAPTPPVGTYFEAPPSPTYYRMSTSILKQILTQMLVHVPTPMATPILLSMPTSILTYLSFVMLYGYSSVVLQTPTASLFYRGGSTSHSSKEEGDRDEAESRDEDEDDGGDEDEYEGQCEDEEDENDDNDQEEEPTPQL